MAEESIAKSLYSVEGNTTTAGGMSRTVNQNREDNNSFSNSSIKSANSVIIIDGCKDAEDGSIKPPMHIDASFLEEEQEEKLNKAVEDMDMNSTLSVSSQVDGEKNNMVTPTNDHNMEVEGQPPIKRSNEDTLPSNANEGSESPSFKAYNKKVT